MKETAKLPLVIFLTLLAWMFIGLIGVYFFPPIETVTATEVKKPVRPYVVYGECPDRFRDNRFDAEKCQNRFTYYRRNCAEEELDDPFFMCDAGDRAGASQYCTGYSRGLLSYGYGGRQPKGFKRTCSELRALIFEEHGIRIIRKNSHEDQK